MTISMLFSAALFGFVTSVTPGPNNTFLLNSAVNFGIKKSLPYLFGIFLGITVMLAAIAAGFGAVFEVFPVVYQLLKWVGFAYILWLSILIISSTSKSSTGKANYIGFWKSVAFQFVNPKAWIVMASFMATMVPLQEGVGVIAVFIAVMVITSFPGALVWAVAGQILRNWLSQPKARKIFNITSAVLLVFSMIPVLFLH